MRSAAALCVALAFLALCGCSVLMSSATTRLSASLGAAVLDENDPETVRQGAPAYLLLIDGLIADDPDNAGLLLNGARLYSSYAGAFVADPERAGRLAAKGRDYGWRGLCRSERRACGIWEAPYERFEAVVDSLPAPALPALYAAAGAWATYIETHRDDWSAVADKARVEAMIRRVIELDDGYDQGFAHVYLGVLATLLPEALGGHPEEGRREFERAIELSGQRNLMAKTLLARDYARALFDRELHDRLLGEVLAADPMAPGLTLTNVLAQQEARRLLDDADDYFGE